MSAVLRPAPIGAPGAYLRAPRTAPAPGAERMDVAAFVGVAPRGPARGHTPGAAGTPGLAQPMAVESWDAYRRLYGGFEGPGLMPYAVASFFENGGRRAYIVRVVHDYRRPDGTVDDAAIATMMPAAPFAGGTIATAGIAPVWVRARNEGSWGNRLSATLSFRTRPLAGLGVEAGALLLPLRHELVPGALLRLGMAGGGWALRRVMALSEEWEGGRPARRRIRARLDAAIVPTDVQGLELVEGELVIDDGDGRGERHAGLGLSPAHPRWLGRVLAEESELLLPAVNPELPAGDPAALWDDGRELDLDPTLLPAGTKPFRAAGGAPAIDGYGDITHDDFLDAGWVPGDDASPRGIHALVELPDLSLLTVPDLYAPGALPPVTAPDPGAGAGARFAECVHATAVAPAPAPVGLDGLTLDPRLDLETIVAWQQDVVTLCDQLAGPIALLDVPPGLPDRAILRWRDRFGSMYAAAYHPWCRTVRRDDRRAEPVRVPPSALAAGLIARSELEFSLHRGPANLPALGVYGVADRVSDARHDILHPAGINVFLHEPDAVRLTAARTLSRDARWRQLSVRRLFTMLRRTLARQLQWVTFEPNGAPLWDALRSAIEARLAELFRDGAFAGARREDSYFVRCDRTTMTQNDLDTGRLICLIGAAPAEPTEFLVVQLVREGDGTLRMTE